MKKITTLKTLLVGLCAMGATSAWAEQITATLTHTASSFCEKDPSVFTSTVDAATEHVNNSNFSAAWAGSAYADFSFTIPEGVSITKATLTFQVIGESRRDRDAGVYYANASEQLDYDVMAGGNANVNLAATSIATVTFPKGSSKVLTLDVTDAMKAIVATGQSNIIFKWTGNPGGGDVAGKTSDNAPTLVFETADASTQTKYTVKFTDGTNELKEAVEYDGTIGENATASDDDLLSFIDGDKKWIYESGNEAIELTADESSNIISLVFREAASYSYSVTSSLGTTIATGSYFEGETLSVGYPRFELNGTDLYEAGATSKEYRTAVELKEDNVSKTIEYKKIDGKSVVFFTEAENIEGITVSTDGNIPVRASNALGATTTEDVVITTLPAGSYIFHAGIFTSKTTISGLVANFGIGDETFEAAFTSVNLNEIASEKYKLNEETTISYLASSSAGTQFDYLWIEQVEDIPENVTVTVTDAGWATLYTDYALNFEGTGLTAYTATLSESTVTLTEVTSIAAGTGVVLKGDANTYEIPVIDGSDTAKGDLKGDATAAKTADGTQYVLVMNGENAQFTNVTAGSEIAAGKAYLEKAAGARILNVVFAGEATSIKAIETAQGDGNVYNMAGQRVAAPQKGLYIMNGKKVIIK